MFKGQGRADVQSIEQDPLIYPAQLFSPEPEHRGPEADGPEHKNTYHQLRQSSSYGSSQHAVMPDEDHIEKNIQKTHTGV